MRAICGQLEETVRSAFGGKIGQVKVHYATLSKDLEPKELISGRWVIFFQIGVGIGIGYLLIFPLRSNP